MAAKKKVSSKKKAALKPIPIVGIGASAGGMEAFKAFLAAMPVDSGAALVLIQHLDPSHESMIVEPLGKYTSMPVQQAEEAMVIKPNHVYVIPPNRYLGIDGNRLVLSEAVKYQGMRMSIDFFFRSLAEQCEERAICIVLSGTGSDGSLGLKAVKGAGGMAMAEDAKSAAYDGMPSAAAKTGLVDFILPVSELPATLVRYICHPYIMKGDQAKLVETAPSDHFHTILSLLRTQTNYDFRSYKRGTLTRRIERRLGLKHMQNLAEYVDFLRSDPNEIHQLFRDLLIGVTSFFRNPDAWEILENEVLAKIVAEKEDDDKPVRVWVAGCTSGEEPYSIAMILFEQFALAKKPFNAQIFATDIDENAINEARSGRYPRSIAADVPAERLRQFFIEDGDDYVVSKHLRESVVFAEQNLISDPPFSKLDVITCRNVLIYLETSIQNRIIQMFHFALKEDGCMFLGNSESTGKQQELFRALSKPHRLFRKFGKSSFAQTSFPVAHSEERPALRKFTGNRATTNSSIGDMAQSVLLQRFAPASVLINRSYDVLYFHGPTRQYLDYPSGEPTRDLTVICLAGLKNKLRGAVHQAAAEKKPVSTIARKAKRNGDLVDVRITAEILTTPGVEDFFLITFQDEHQIVRLPIAIKEIYDDDSELVNQLEHELQVTREDLQSSIEELEFSNEELKASNEEVMSMNEELQSTNEEMETSREELQSLNEELSTVNTQLEDKVLELESTNNDVSNLLSSTDIATIFLDTEFKIRRYTPATRDLVSLIQSDIGRPISDIALRFTDDQLLDDARLVLDKLTPSEREVRDDDDHVYIRRIMPYRTQDNHIMGVVLTFTNISERSLAERSRRISEQRLALATEATGVAIWDRDLVDGAFWWNAEYERLFGERPATNQTSWKWWTDRLHPDDRERIVDSIGAAIDSRAGSWAGEYRFRGISGAFIEVIDKASIARDEDSKAVRIIGGMHDMTEQKQTEQRLHRAERLASMSTLATGLAHEIKNPLAALMTAAQAARNIMGKQAVSDDKLEKSLENVAESATRCDEIVVKLRHFAGLQANDKRLCDPNALVQQAAESAHSFCDNHGARIELDLESGLPTMKLNALAIELLLLNLIQNAAPPGTNGINVSIRTEQSANQIRLIVEDNGVGISQEAMEHAFEPFYSTHQNEGGMGLGLSIAYGIVEDHDGSIHITGKPKKGTTVTVTLPIRSE